MNRNELESKLRQLLTEQASNAHYLGSVAANPSASAQARAQAERARARMTARALEISALRRQLATAAA